MADKQPPAHTPDAEKFIPSAHAMLSNIINGKATVIEEGLLIGQDEPLDLRIPRTGSGENQTSTRCTASTDDQAIEQEPARSTESGSLEDVDPDASFITLDALSPAPGGKDMAEDTPILEEGELTESEENVESWGDLPEVNTSQRSESRSVWDSEQEVHPWDLPMEVQEIQKKGIYSLLPDTPGWMTRVRGYSMHILHDGLLRAWPVKSDRKCCLEFRSLPSVSRWTDIIRAGKLVFRGHSIVVSLNSLRERETLGQLKNSISSLVRALRAAVPEVRVYICNSLVGRHKVLGPRARTQNQRLVDAVDSLKISDSIRKVFVVDMAHRFDESDIPIKERRNDQYLDIEGTTLTYLGCLWYRARLFEEMGLTTVSRPMADHDHDLQSEAKEGTARKTIQHIKNEHFEATV